MLLCIFFCSLILLLIIAFNYKNNIVLAICIHYLGIEFFSFLAFSHMSRILQYPIIFSTDIKFFLAVIKIYVSSYTIVKGIVLSVGIILFADLMILCSVVKLKRITRIIWCAVIVVFMVINLSDVKYIIMLNTYNRTIFGYNAYEFIEYIIKGFSCLLIFISLLAPIYCIIQNYKITHISYKRFCINITMINLLLIDVFEVMILFVLPTKYMAPWNLDEFCFPNVSGDIYNQILMRRPFLITLIIMFAILFVSVALIYTKPIKFFSGTKSINKRMIKNLNKNTLMLFHAYKNSFWGISQLSEQAINNPDIAVSNLKAIKESSTISYEAVCRAMKMISFSKSKENEIVNLSECIIKTANSLHSGNIKIKLDIPYDTIYVKMNKEHLSEVLLNVFQNSIEAINLKGTDNGEISAVLYCEPGSAELKITDNGVGIKRAMLKQLFGLFNSTKHGNYHFGIGLNFSRMAISAYNGHISIKSKYGEYTTTTLLFPIINEGVNNEK
ncbi:MAG: ATP-binding protein [Clostridia bacterium]|nr:ATP-binding protein [Clostridia bacterium]